MDRTVPRSAAILLDFIRKIETGKADASAYDVIYAHAQGRLPKPITKMTIAELQGHQAKGWPAKSTASGGYQFMRATLGELRKELGLRDSQLFDADLQDRLGYHLLKRRGYEKFAAGTLSLIDFGNNLAKEWASMPVLSAIKGAHQQLKPGQSYYAGDALNKSLVDVMTFRAVLSEAINEVSREKPIQPPKLQPAPPIPEAPQTPAESTARALPKAVLWLVGILVAVAFVIYVITR